MASSVVVRSRERLLLAPVLVEGGTLSEVDGSEGEDVGGVSEVVTNRLSNQRAMSAALLAFVTVKVCEADGSASKSNAVVVVGIAPAVKVGLNALLGPSSTAAVQVLT